MCYCWWQKSLKLETFLCICQCRKKLLLLDLKIQNPADEISQPQGTSHHISATIQYSQGVIFSLCSCPISSLSHFCSFKWSDVFTVPLVRTRPCKHVPGETIWLTLALENVQVRQKLLLPKLRSFPPFSFFLLVSTNHPLLSVNTENTTDIFWKVLGSFTIVNCVNLLGFYPLCKVIFTSPLSAAKRTLVLLRAPGNHQSTIIEIISFTA